MKARVKGGFHFVTKGRFLCCKDDGWINIEADSIELVPDEPEKREVRDGDCGIIADHIAVVSIGVDLLNGSIEPVRPIRYQSAAKHLFNLLDVIAEGKKAKNGTTEKFNNSLVAQNNGDGIGIFYDCRLVTNMTYENFAHFCMQGFALSRGAK